MQGATVVHSCMGRCTVFAMTDDLWSLGMKDIVSAATFLRMFCVGTVDAVVMFGRPGYSERVAHISEVFRSGCGEA